MSGELRVDCCLPGNINYFERYYRQDETRLRFQCSVREAMGITLISSLLVAKIAAGLVQKIEHRHLQLLWPAAYGIMS